MLAIHEFYHDSEKKYTLKHGKFFEIFNVAAKPMVMENLERSWRKSWKVKEFQELKRVQTLMGGGKFCLSNILARKMHILIMSFCKTRIDLRAANNVRLVNGQCPVKNRFCPGKSL